MKNFNLIPIAVTLLLVLSSGNAWSQGQMRGESTPSGAAKVTEVEFFTVGDDLAAPSVAASAEAGTGKSVAMDFGQSADREGIAEMTTVELEIALFKMIGENQRLVVELKEVERLQQEVANLKDQMAMLESGWEPIQD